MRMGPRFKVHCSNIVSIYGHEINLSNSIRYLGVYLTANNVYSCSFSHVERFTPFIAHLMLFWGELVVWHQKKLSLN